MTDTGRSLRDAEFDNYPIEDKSKKNVEWIGTIAGGSAPHLYEEHTNTIYETEIDEEAELVIPKNPHPLEGKSLGEYIEEIGEERGWDSLSEFARKHLEHEDG